MNRIILQLFLVLAATVPAVAQIGQFQAPRVLQTRAAALHAEARPKATTSVQIAKLNLKAGRPGQLARMAAASPVATTTTPFVQDVNVRLASMWGGRLEFGGFQSQRPMDSLLNGLPGSGSRPSWGTGSRANSGALTPSGSDSYGLRLTVALGSAPSESDRTEAWRCLARMVGMRGCRLN